MFINERPALVHMALQTRLLIVMRRRNQSRPRPRPPCRSRIPVRIMAIRALHRPLVHPVLRRHFKLPSYRRMALITKLRLLLRQQKLRRRRLMHRVAIRTNHIRLRMRRLPNPRPRNVLRVAPQARIQRLLRRKLRKRLYRRLPAFRRHMVAARAMATFAPRVLRHFLARSNRLKVRILIEVQPNVRMAHPAGRTSHKSVFFSRRHLCNYQKRQAQTQRDDEFHQEPQTV